MTRDGDLRLLSEGSAALGAPLDAAQQDQVLRYLDLLYIWNRTAGLTTISREAAVRLHILDSLGAKPAIGSGPCLDLGTGAGLPGIVLAIALGDVRFQLVESNRKKCSFLLEVVRSLELRNVRVVQADADVLPRDHGFPVVISRAFRKPAEFLATAAGLVAPNGRVLLMTAHAETEDLLALGRSAGLALQECRRFSLPEGGEPRAVASFVPSGAATVSRETEARAGSAS